MTPLLFDTAPPRSAKTAPTTQKVHSYKTSVTAELPRAQLASLRPTTAPPPWLSPKNTTILVLLQRNQDFTAKTNGSKAPPSRTPPSFALAHSPIRKIASAWHADEAMKSRSTRVTTSDGSGANTGLSFLREEQRFAGSPGRSRVF